MATIFDFLYIFLLVLANGFFVASEFALVTVRKTRIEELMGQGDARAITVNSALMQIDRYIAGTQIGITLASLALGWIGEPTISEFIAESVNLLGLDLSQSFVHTISIAFGFTFITFLHVIIGELVPKSLALQKSETTSLLVARPMAVAVFLLQPFIWSLNGLGNMILRVLGLESSNHENAYSTKELSLLFRESHKAGVLNDLEKTMLQRTIRFSDISVAEVMTPRSEIMALDLGVPSEEFLAKAFSLGRSRIPVFKGDLDHIQGVIHTHELSPLQKTDSATILKKVHQPVFVPETLHLGDVFSRLREHDAKMAIVIDEYGGTAGLVTFEDILNIIFGKIHLKKLAAHAENSEIRIPGETLLFELCDSFGWEFENNGGVDTIAGYIMHILGRVAKIGDTVSDKHRTYRVEEMDHYRIEWVRITSKRPSGA